MSVLDLADKRVLVLGLGDTGWSMTRWLAARGARVRVADSRREPPHAVALRRELPHVPLHTGALAADTLAEVDLIAMSPGVPLADPAVQAAARAGIEIVGDVELFARALNVQAAQDPRADSPKVIAITGSNGKSTVTSMVGGMFKAAGFDTVVAGNIGLPVLDALQASAQAYVLELSSFQLETTSSLHVDAASVLNLTEDHMDRYADMAHYAAAKARIFLHCKTQVLNREDAASRAMARAGARVFEFGLDAPTDAGQWGLVRRGETPWLADERQVLLPVDELPVAGLHNAANALAALALARAVDLPYAPLLAALRGFRGLPHRVEKVDEIDGVTFYDDSKGTNVGATVAALRGMREPVVLIAGGEGKGQDFTPLREPLQAKARAVVLIGRDAAQIGALASAAGVRQLCADSMERAVELAFAHAKRGDAVLLSPACASFDMFDNYGHRGRVFVAAVQALAAQRAGKKRTG